MATQFGATGTKAQTTRAFGSPFERRTHAPQAGHEITEKNTIQIRQGRKK
jgi:hypothetical protein